MACDEWMRRLGVQDNIKEEVLRSEDCFARAIAEKGRQLQAEKDSHLHKERVEPKP